MAKIGILGGAFDPVTKGHVEVAEYVLRHTDLDRIWLMPVPQHPWEKKMAPYSDRLRMIQLTLAYHDPRITWSTYERDRELSGKTWETIRSLQRAKSHKGDIFYWIVGTDEAVGVTYWSHSEWLKEHAKFIVVPRIYHWARSKNGNDPFRFTPWILHPPHINLQDSGVVGKTSSTAARKAIQDGKKGLRRLKRLLSPNVVSYIQTKKLYLNLTTSPNS